MEVSVSLCYCCCCCCNLFPYVKGSFELRDPNIILFFPILTLLVFYSLPALCFSLSSIGTSFHFFLVKHAFLSAVIVHALPKLISISASWACIADLPGSDTGPPLVPLPDEAMHGNGRVMIQKRKCQKERDC
jgi:hypothetical protein